MKTQNAQDLINEIEREHKQEEIQNLKAKQRANEFKQVFYKTLYDLEQADLNITKCLKELN